MPPIGSIDSASISFRPYSYGRLEQVGGRVDAASASRQRSADLQRLDSDLGGLREVLENLASHARRLSRAGAGTQARSASATSQVALAIGVATFTTLRSSAEINAISTSFSPFGPTVNGSSTTLPTLGGIYDGSLGDDVLTFEFRQNRTIPTPDSLQVWVYDGLGRRIETLQLGGVPADTPVTLSNGMTLSLSAGDADRRDTFQVNVYASVGSVVDTTKSFDGTRNDQPNLEPGLGVTAGSFQVNGVTISVAADDSIDSVLAKINASGAGVDAQFDAASESIVLTSLTPGSTGRVLLTNDTSGFLAATKLASATEVRGSDAPDTLYDPISQVSALASITAGLFSVNGVSLSVDPASDSLADVIDRINSSGAGASASFDTVSQRFSIASTSGTAKLTLSDGDSGFFSALEIPPGVYDPTQAQGGGSPLSFQRRGELRDDLLEVSRALDDFLQREVGEEAESAVSALRKGLSNALKGGLEGFGGASASSRLGLDFESGESGLGSLGIDSQRLERALRQRPSEVFGLLYGKRSSTGLVDAVLSEVAAVQSQFELLLGGGSGLGRLVNLFT